MHNRQQQRAKWLISQEILGGNTWDVFETIETSESPRAPLALSRRDIPALFVVSVHIQRAARPGTGTPGNTADMALLHTFRVTAAYGD
jgi:hypothetical protein